MSKEDIIDEALKSLDQVFTKPARDPARIRPFLETLAELWEQNADLRFGQIVRWVRGPHSDFDAFQFIVFSELQALAEVNQDGR